MREKPNIERIIVLLKQVWEKFPDMRFHQLVSNLQHMYSAQNDEYGRRRVIQREDSGYEFESSYLDFFYLNDKDWERFLLSMLTDSVPVDSEKLKRDFTPVLVRSECTHYLFKDSNDEERMNNLYIKYHHLYPVYYDENEGEYYVVNEKGEQCLSIELLARVEMYKKKPTSE